MVKRVYVEKKPGFDVMASKLTDELKNFLQVEGLESVRLLNRYDVEISDDELFNKAVNTVFSEPAVDNVLFSVEDIINSDNNHVFAVEYLPGQFDARANSASECIQFISQGERPAVNSATVYVLDGNLSDIDVAKIKDYLINPVEAREASLEVATDISKHFEAPSKVEVIDDFLTLNEEGLSEFIKDLGLAMDLNDAKFMQAYFLEEGRPPTITEVKMIDTYWSDHCRHTTFGTEFATVNIEYGDVQQAYDAYIALRGSLGHSDKTLCFMDIATIGARALKAAGKLDKLDESDEINACTVRVDVDVDGKDEEWLYLFKNETHNHPTEIEPFGGAATCLGGAIRDPLSGRAYVYQAMRVTGAADPRTSVQNTIEGKLPQRKIVTEAAHGYSSYGNQIGLATGKVSEIYHPGYAAKRMEIGVVCGAVPACSVRREVPTPGDVVLLVGGDTGRDGIGGATGSSKSHSASSLDTCGAEVQKGNAPVERKIQRLFRNPDAASLIKRCNDFGAGGVSVAIGELADSLEINLDSIPKKYAGLDGTELAISESQERMAVVVDLNDVDTFISLAAEENLNAVPVAVVTDSGRVKMTWEGDTIVDISREFLAKNGAPKLADITVGILRTPSTKAPHAGGTNTLSEHMFAIAKGLNSASTIGLSEMFDSTIGASTVLMPYGGKHQLTPSQAMVSKFPVLNGQTTTVSGLSWGFDPRESEVNPFVGAYMAVTDSINKLVATGFERKKMYLTLQEYFEKLGSDPKRWGKPFSALLGALSAQLNFGVAAIGGKDSMSGSFEDLDVPPTLVSFATATGNIDNIVSPEFKAPHSRIVLITPATNNPKDAARAIDVVEYIIKNKFASAASAVSFGGLLEALFLMCLGNRLGIKFAPNFDAERLKFKHFGSFVVELAPDMNAKKLSEIMHRAGFNVPVKIPNTTVSADANDAACVLEDVGITTQNYTMATNYESIDLAEAQEVWESTLEGVYPYRSVKGESEQMFDEVPAITYSNSRPPAYHEEKFARPRVIIPVFPGTNCEYDTRAAFEAAGGRAKLQVIKNLEPEHIAASITELAHNITQSEILMLPGGFSGGDEPDGSAKFIAAFLRAPEVTEAIRELLFLRDGLVLGICNGFQALVKSGLLPYGDIKDPTECEATLTFNNIGRHQSKLVNTRVCSNISPWLAECPVGETYKVAISHGEGRFVCPQTLLDDMIDNGQIATQYVDEDGKPSMDLRVNPNGSILAIEGITSSDGHIFGKMGHSERRGRGLYKNAVGNLYQPIFESGIKYFQ